jgi:nanoRNase/pAp phosphatase (c-di-AMP/oligoRNAs hydrolase)
MTDTGSFRFSSASASVHRMVAVLKETGLDHSKVHENLLTISWKTACVLLAMPFEQNGSIV